MEDRDEYARGGAAPTRRVDAGVTEPIGGWRPSGEPGQDTEPLAAQPADDGTTQRRPYVASPPQQPPYIPGSDDGDRAPASADPWAASRHPASRHPAPRRNPFAWVAAVLAVILAIVIAFQVGSCTATSQAASRAASSPTAVEPPSPEAATTAPETGESADSSGGETLGSLVGDALDKLGSIDLGDVRSQLGDAASQLSEGAKNAAGSAADLLNRLANS